MKAYKKLLLFVTLSLCGGCLTFANKDIEKQIAALSAKIEMLIGFYSNLAGLDDSEEREALEEKISDILAKYGTKTQILSKISRLKAMAYEMLPGGYKVHKERLGPEVDSRGLVLGAQEEKSLKMPSRSGGSFFPSS